MTKIWVYIGKTGVLITIFWGIIQIYNYFSPASGYKAITKGNHVFYETSPLHMDNYIKSFEYRALVKTIIQNEGSLKNYDLDSLLLRYKDSNDFTANYYFLNVNSWETQFKTIWTFSIKNVGNRPLEEVALEIPFEGLYKVSLPNNVTKQGNFKNQVEIGGLKPSYEAQIICWTTSDLRGLDSYEEKSRFTHKYGWFNISYPIEVNGLIAWDQRKNHAPFVWFLYILSILFLIVFGIGFQIGGKRVEKKNPRKFT